MADKFKSAYVIFYRIDPLILWVFFYLLNIVNLSKNSKTRI